MTLPGETVGTEDEIRCSMCKVVLPLKVCSSNAGYYIGYSCITCGPYSRETVYFADRPSAEAALKEMESGKGAQWLRW